MGILFKQRIAPTTGTTAAVNTSKDDILMIVDISATIAALTIPLPTTPVDGQLFGITTRSIITALTLSLGGIPMSGAITTLAAGGVAWWIYDSTSNRWFRYH